MKLEVRNLFCGYGQTDVLKGINLDVEAGAFLAVAGPNGCGKSTLLKAIARLLPYRGSAAIDGRDTAALSRKELARRLALLAQSPVLYFPYTVYDTVAMGRYAHSSGIFGGFSDRDRAVVEKVLEALDLNGIRSKLANELSGGLLQRVFLARTLVQEPEIILLDEPTNHLDLQYQRALLEYLTDWAGGKGRAVVAVLHDLNLARRYGTTALLLEDGAVMAAGTTEAVFNSGELRRVYGMDVGGFMRESLKKWNTTI